MYSSNIDQIIAELSKVPDVIEEKVAALMRRIVMEIDVAIHRRTPVWSGRAIRNMVWSKGNPNATEFDPIASGEIGESRREANSSAARQSLNSLDFHNPYAVYWLSNNAHHISGLEAGLLPYPGAHPVGGMFGLTYAEVVTKLGTL